MPDARDTGVNKQDMVSVLTEIGSIKLFEKKRKKPHLHQERQRCLVWTL